jgi:hypothetical protein
VPLNCAEVYECLTIVSQFLCFSIFFVKKISIEFIGLSVEMSFFFPSKVMRVHQQIIEFKPYVSGLLEYSSLPFKSDFYF